MLPRETLQELVRLADELYIEAYREAGPQYFPPHGTGEVVSTISRSMDLSITDRDGSTSFDEKELDEFFGRLGDPFDSYRMYWSYYSAWFDTPTVEVAFDGRSVDASVTHRDSRAIDRILRVIRDAAAANRISIPEPEPERPRVFIGHGGSGEWRKTEQWLRTLNVEVQAFETLPHSGRTIERVLTNALDWANFALLVMTAEDERTDATVQARQNVVHELGLFQGRLGWDQALVLLEDGTAEFSNIAGTNQLRFPKGAIDAKHGDIIVALRWRFGRAI